MGSAILAGILKSCAATRATGAEPRFTKFIACVNSDASVERLRTRFAEYEDVLKVYVKANVEGMSAADVVLLGVKPYMVEDVLGEEGVAFALMGKLTISFLVGTPIEKIYKILHSSGSKSMMDKIAVTRVMVNIAAEYGEALTVVDNVPLPSDYSEITQWMFSQLGKVSLVESSVFDVGGLIAGSSAVFFSVAFDGVLDGAVAQGLKRPAAREMLTQALVGFVKLLEAGNTPDQIREKISSPRGTSIEGLMSLEEDRVRYAYTKCINQATKRSREM